MNLTNNPLKDAVHASTSTYTVAALGFLALNARDSTDIYRLAPNLLPRTVRYITVELVRLLGLLDSLNTHTERVEGENPSSISESNVSENALMSLISKNVSAYEESTAHPVPSDTELEELKVLSKKASVPFVTAMLSATKFRNPLEVVRQTLTDIGELLSAQCENVKPVGLFVWAMRHGEKISLPTRILEAREAAENAKALEEKTCAVTTVDSIVIYLGRVKARVIRFLKNLDQVEIELLTDSSLGEVGTIFRVPLTQVRQV